MQRRTVLIVDDQEINRKILENILKKEYDVLLAENGKAALECLEQRKDMISAVLVDITMPVMDGYEFLRVLKSNEELSMIPVIVSAQKDGDETEIKAFSLGAQDFVTKPYKAEIIRQRLSNLIRLRESASTINRIQKDQITGLLNKEVFISRIEDTLKQKPNKKFDILFFGIERFKLVNDSYGTKKGNEVLRYLAELLQESIGKNSICSRFGADNFYVFCEHREYTNEMFAEPMKKVRSCPVELDIKIHCGIYEIMDTALEIDTMCDRAKLAADSNRGKYDIYFSYYDDSLRNRIVEEQFILSTMYTALEEQQFQVYYQPKYDLNSEVIVGAEALVRWIHPEKGFMSPGEFIPVFEQNGFITHLDRFVWESTCRDIRQWMDNGYPAIAVSVNVSRADIYNPKLIHILMELISKYQIPIRYLHLEITESAYTENPKQIIDTVKKLREAGFVIEMDDFGTGYSSLNMLAEMPVDVMKLDMRFIQTEANASSGKGILSFIISLAKWMELAVVAEGVETSQQAEVLRSMGCNYVQGYYYARPMKREEFEKLISSTPVIEMICNSRNRYPEVYEREVVSGTTKERVMLIVDDIKLNRAVLISAFLEDYTIVEKENGQTAWNYLNEHYDEVEIVMLDLLMPVMDGFQLLGKIRADKRMKDLPVIITSQGDADSERRALAMQADDFILKPYNPDVIKHRVNNVVGNHQLELMKAGLMKKEELKKSTGQKGIVSVSVDRKIEQTVKMLSHYFDIVRLVDPIKNLVHENDSREENKHSKCFSVWKKTGRCSNCTSCRAYEHQCRLTKLEYSEKGLFLVISQYVPYGKHGAVLEIAAKLEDEYTFRAFDKDMLKRKLEEINIRLEKEDSSGAF